jgi:hypothetical protein
MIEKSGKPHCAANMLKNKQNTLTYEDLFLKMAQVCAGSVNQIKN